MHLTSGLIGGLAGGLGTAVLVMIFAVEHWMVLLPIGLGVAVGILGGERGLRRVLEIVGSL